MNADKDSGREGAMSSRGIWALGFFLLTAEGVLAGRNQVAADLPAGADTALPSFPNRVNGVFLERRVQPSLSKPGAAVTFEWSRIGSPQAVKDAIPVTIRAKDANGFTAVSFEGQVEFLAGLRSLFWGNPRPRVLFSEINTTLQDWVEFTNVTEEPVDVSGWQFTAYDWQSWPAPSVTFTFPEGTVCGPGEVFLVYDEGTAPGAYPVFNVGGNIAWNNSPENNELAILLRDETGRIVDFVCGFDASFSQIQDPLRIPDSEWNGRAFLAYTNPGKTIHRIGQGDRNDYYDWDNYPPSPGKVDALMVLPFVGLPVPLEMGPTVSGPFTQGVWSGQIAVREPGRFIGVRARAAEGLEGLSNTFDVVPYAGFYEGILDVLLGRVDLAQADRGKLDVNGDGRLDVADLLYLKAVGAAAESPSQTSPSAGLESGEQKVAGASLEGDEPIVNAFIQPDLVLESLWWRDGGFTDADEAKISFRVINAGGEESPACSYEVRLDGTALPRGTLPALAKDGGEWVLENFSFGKLSIGDHALSVAVDPDDRIEEIKEGNNSRTVILPVRIGPRTIEAVSQETHPFVRSVQAPIVLSRGGGAAGVNLRVETDPAVFRVAEVSAPASVLPGLEVHWYAPTAAAANIVVLFAPQGALAETSLEIVQVRLDLVAAKAPLASWVRVTLGAVSDAFGGSSPAVTLVDGEIKFRTATEDWQLY